MKSQPSSLLPTIPQSPLLPSDNQLSILDQDVESRSVFAGKKGFSEYGVKLGRKKSSAKALVKDNEPVPTTSRTLRQRNN